MRLRRPICRKTLFCCLFARERDRDGDDLKAIDGSWGREGYASAVWLEASAVNEETTGTFLIENEHVFNLSISMQILINTQIDFFSLASLVHSPIAFDMPFIVVGSHSVTSSKKLGDSLLSDLNFLNFKII